MIDGFFKFTFWCAVWIMLLRGVVWMFETVHRAGL